MNDNANCGLLAMGLWVGLWILNPLVVWLHSPELDRGLVVVMVAANSVVGLICGSLAEKAARRGWRS